MQGSTLECMHGGELGEEIREACFMGLANGMPDPSAAAASPIIDVEQYLYKMEGAHMFTEQGLTQQWSIDYNRHAASAWYGQPGRDSVLPLDCDECTEEEHPGRAVSLVTNQRLIAASWPRPALRGMPSHAVLVLL